MSNRILSFVLAILGEDMGLLKKLQSSQEKVD